MPLAKHLTRREGTYYFRIRVPRKLLLCIGRNEIVYSLRTKEPAEAKRLSHIHSYNFLSYFAELEKGLSTSTPTVSNTFHLNFDFGNRTTDITNKKENIPDKLLKKVSIPTFEDIMNMYFNERKMTQSSEVDYIGAYKRLSKCIGNKPINEYSMEDIRKFKDILLTFPIGNVNVNKIDNIHNYIKQISAKNKDYRRISPVTVHKIIIRINTVFNYAVANGYLVSNPASQIQVFTPKQTEPTRLPFTTGELNKIFSAKLYRENSKKMDKSRIQDCRILILLGFFTGGRMEELARLTTDDIGCENGIYYIYIHGERDTNKRVKNISSIRRIPLHSKLLELGFGDYYREMLSSGHKKFFPSLYRSKEIRGKITHYFSKWFGLFLDGLGITEKTKSFHSFRHTMKRLLRDAGIEKSVCDAYQGHSMSDIASTYGRDEYNMGYSLAFLKEQIERIDYSQIDFRYVKLTR